LDFHLTEILEDEEAIGKGIAANAEGMKGFGDSD
jgi:hypothetical protein